MAATFGKYGGGSWWWLHLVFAGAATFGWVLAFVAGIIPTEQSSRE